MRTAASDNLIVTRDMHERKRKMFELADAFVALPGGVGTLEEIVEQMTWAQLGRHKKPILLANIKDFWEPLCALLDHMKKLEFIRGDLISTCWSPTRSRTSCRCCKRRPKRCPTERQGNDGGRSPTGCSRYACGDERHRFDAVAVGIADEGGVIAVVYCGRKPGAPSEVPPPASAAA